MAAEPQPARVGGVTVISQSAAQRYGMGVFLVVIFAALAVRIFAGSPATSAVVAGIVVMVVIAVFFASWIRLLMHPTHLTVSESAITFTGMKGELTMLTRQPGAELVLVLTGGWRYRQLKLTVNGAGPAIPLNMYSKPEVRRVCEATGWQFRGATASRRR